MKKKKLTYTFEEATRLLEEYCIYQDRCHAEVEQKLKSMHMISAAIAKITLHLLENNFLNEERYAKSFVRGKHKIKRWGKRKIEKELSMKGISSFNIRTGLLEIEEESYQANLLALTEKKYAELGGKKLPDNRKKLFSYLIQKGYESDLIYEVLSKFGVDEN